MLLEEAWSGGLMCGGLWWPVEACDDFRGGLEWWPEVLAWSDGLYTYILNTKWV